MSQQPGAGCDDRAPLPADNAATSLTDVVLSHAAVRSAGALAGAALSAGIPKVLSMVPVLGTFVDVIGATTEIRTKLLLRRIGVFLGELTDVTDAEREAFRAELEQDPGHRESVGEHLITLLDRLDDTEKARLAGMLFSAFLRRRLSYPEFRLAAAAVDRAHICDLEVIARDPQAQLGDVGSRLFAAGLTRLHVTQIDHMPALGGLRSFQIYPVNDLGRLVLDTCYPHFAAERRPQPHRHSPGSPPPAAPEQSAPGVRPDS